MTEYFIQIVVDAAESNADLFVAAADAFFDLAGISEQDAAADGGLITFSMSLTSADEVSALSTAIAAVRTSIHAAGGATPGWENDIEMVRTVIEKDGSRETV